VELLDFCRFWRFRVYKSLAVDVCHKSRVGAQGSEVPSPSGVKLPLCLYQRRVLMSWATKLSKPYRIDHGKKFRLQDFDPGATAQIRSKEHAEELLEKSIAEMAELQDKLYAQDRWAVLLIFQAMDAAGKDGAIKHVMSGVNPQGCQVYSFKAPSSEDLNHDFLWRTSKCLPERGHIGIFNRSYY